MTPPFASLPSGHQTMLLTHRAMVRDLGRVHVTAGRLAESPDPERARALMAYVDKLFQVIKHHHEGEDAFLWPRLRELGADEDALALVISEHEELLKQLLAWHDTSRNLGADPEAAAELARLTVRVRDEVVTHTKDEERELAGRLAPALDSRIWKGFETYMLKTAPLWTLRFMPPWLASVAGPEERGGVPAAPMARLFRGWLERDQRAAFGVSG